MEEQVLADMRRGKGKQFERLDSLSVPKMMDPFEGGLGFNSRPLNYRLVFPQTWRDATGFSL